ncbi:MAG: DUF3108 domain-containing protein [Prevotellaceae bacterium]|nr:DUF3108 domain-containing protein [Prevotellaceae bacterium]
MSTSGTHPANARNPRVSFHSTLGYSSVTPAGGSPLAARKLPAPTTIATISRLAFHSLASLRLFIIGILFLVAPVAAHAQTPLTNTAFSPGERLEYKLYFNWKFIWIGAGDASLFTQSDTYDGKPAYRSLMLTHTSKRIDRYFCMRDTLLSIVTEDLIPLYYRKGANEGGKLRLNEVTYSYPHGQSQVQLLYVNPSGEKTELTVTDPSPVFDMLSMLLRARSFDGSAYKVGDRIEFKMADGKRVEKQTLIYRGKKNFKSEEEQNTTYRCLVFSFVEKKGKKESEVITFYVTDDDNHIPVRLDMFLRFGVAKAYLKSATGVRHPLTSVVKSK